MNKKRISITLPPELLEKLKYIALQEHRTVSGMVRFLVRQYVEKWELGPRDER